MADTSGGVDPAVVSNIFWADPTGMGLTYEQLKARRAIAAALASKSLGYPNTVGKGIFSAADSLAEAFSLNRLDAQEKAMRERSAKEVAKNRDVFEASPETAAPLTTGPAGGPAQAPVLPAENAPRPPGGAALETDTNVADAIDTKRAQLAAAYLNGPQQGGQASQQQPTRMAALPSLSTMSDAGQPGATYGGPAPAGPGASMAEPPDQSPPAPSAPPPASAGPGPAGTPLPTPATGGGVPPGAPLTGPGPMPQGAVPPGAQLTGPGPMPQGAVPPGAPLSAPVDASRNMLTDAALANQAFNPDAPGPVSGPAGPQLAQVGGVGSAAPPGPAPNPAVMDVPGQPTVQPAPPGSPGRPLPPQGVSPAIPPEYVPSSQGEQNRVFGPPRPMPTAWDPVLREKYNRAIAGAMNPYVSPLDAQKFMDAAKRIEAENTRRYQQEEKAAETQNTRRAEDIRAMETDRREQFRKNTDPEVIGKRNQAIIDNQLAVRGGDNAENVRKDLAANQDASRKVAQRLEDYTMALDALKNGGVFTGYGANARLDGAKFLAWAANNKQLSERAGSTELLKAKLLSTVGQLVAEFKPVSGYETAMGQAMAGNINMEPRAIDTLLRQTIQRGYQELTRYDDRSNAVTGNLGVDPLSRQIGKAVADRYATAKAGWFQDGHLNRFYDGMTGPNAQQHAAAFDDRYGPGAAAFVLNRRKLHAGGP